MSRRWRAFQYLRPRSPACRATSPSTPAGGDLVPSADRARTRAAARQAGPPALPVGQGLVRRRGLPQDRPARARHAHLRRGVRRADRQGSAPRSTSRASRSTTRSVRGDPGGRHGRDLPDREPRADAEPARARGPRRSTTHRAGGARPPGPIQGKAVHPYIEHRRRCARTRRSSIPSTTSRCASRSPRHSASSSSRTRCSTSRWRSPGSRVGEAEGLRRAMSRKRSREALEAYRVALRRGRSPRKASPRRWRTVSSTSSSASRASASRKSHAVAFGLLAYQSAWLRHHYPAEFLCALLNEQPMGFYPPASLVRDAQRRGVRCAHRTSTSAERDARSSSPMTSSMAMRHGVTSAARRHDRARVLAVVGTDNAEALEAERERERPVPGRRRSRPPRGRLRRRRS